jgi:DNA-binding response OmpR family regulator
MANQIILVVDDDPLYLSLIRDFLSEEGYARVLGMRGTCASQTFFHEPPGVVLLEIHAMWPALGWQLLDRLRGDPRTAAVPIIICTTRPGLVAARAAVERCEILEKPFELEELLTRVQVSIGPPRRPDTMDQIV